MSDFQDVSRMKRRLDATFERISSFDSDSSELQEDFARYLCVLVSGYIERSIVQIVQEHARREGAPTLQRFVERKTSRYTSANPERIKELLGSFSQDWRRKIETIMVDEIRDAITSIIKNRHLIAHGRSSDITLGQVRAYYQNAQVLIDGIQELCLEDSID